MGFFGGLNKELDDIAQIIGARRQQQAGIAMDEQNYQRGLEADTLAFERQKELISLRNQDGGKTQGGSKLSGGLNPWSSVVGANTQQPAPSSAFGDRSGQSRVAPQVNTGPPNQTIASDPNQSPPLGVRSSSGLSGGLRPTDVQQAGEFSKKLPPPQMPPQLDANGDGVMDIKDAKTYIEAINKTKVFTPKKREKAIDWLEKATGEDLTEFRGGGYKTDKKTETKTFEVDGFEFTDKQAVAKMNSIQNDIEDRGNIPGIKKDDNEILALRDKKGRIQKALDKFRGGSDKTEVSQSEIDKLLEDF